MKKKTISETALEEITELLIVLGTMVNYDSMKKYFEIKGNGKVQEDEIKELTKSSIFTIIKY
jgi:hypothetical protein